MAEQHTANSSGGAITAPEKVINFTNKYISSFVLSDQVINVSLLIILLIISLLIILKKYWISTVKCFKVSWVLTNDLIAQVTPASTVGNGEKESNRF